MLLLQADPAHLEQMPVWVQWGLNWLAAHELLSKLLILIALDMLSGIMRAGVARRLNSTTSWRGMCRKVIVLVLVGVCATIEPLTGGIPLSKLACIAFMVTEALSITENAVAAGVPVPRWLSDMLIKLREEDQKMVIPLPASSVSVNLPQNSHIEATLTVPPVPVPADHPEPPPP